MPLLKRGGMAIGREVARGAGDLLDDFENNVDVNSALKARGVEVLKNLKKRALAQMDGSGYIKPGKRRKTSQSAAKSGKKQTRKKKPKKKKKKTVKKVVKKRAKKKNLIAKRFDFFNH